MSFRANIHVSFPPVLKFIERCSEGQCHPDIVDALSRAHDRISALEADLEQRLLSYRKELQETTSTLLKERTQRASHFHALYAEISRLTAENHSLRAR